MVVHYKPANAKLANGEVVQPNDHVYISPPWSERDGNPYIVARIIEFLAPDSTPRKNAHTRHGPEPSVRVSLYYRPSDISGRNVSDYRLLLAAIHTDVQPLSNVRGKCYVRHRDRIDDLLSWKKRPDHFYFIKYFDPYIKREFEVLRTENATNMPAEVRETLLGRYEYLITEKEMVADLTDVFRACCVCEKWAASQDSVKCEACKKHYHMACLNPPEVAKPAKGYSWVCPPCSFQRRKDVEEQKFHYGNGSAPKLKAAQVKAKEKGPVDVKRPDVSYRGWPWRYFGLYTNAYDTLDADDPIFPRAATRVGVKYQAVVPTWEDQQLEESQRGSGDLHEAGPSRHITVERGQDRSDRKHESTYDVISTPSDNLATYMDQVRALNGLPVPEYDTERLNQAAAAFTAKGTREGMRHMISLRLADYNPITFTDKETALFEKQLEENGGLDTHSTAKALGKRPAEVLRFSYIWKNKKLKAENDALKAHVKVHTSHARQNKTLGAPSLGRIRITNDSDGSDDEVSLYNAGHTSSSKMQCAACMTRESSVWWRCPRTIHGDAMCESCGANYRKYGVISSTKVDDARRLDKKDHKKKIDLPGSGSATPVPAPIRLAPCACCRRMEPKSAMARCKTCTFAAHTGCYGITSQEMGPEWECELCANVRLEESNLDPRCVLCPKDLNGISAKILSAKTKTKNKPLDFDILSAMKPTEGLRWAHILCSTWMPDVLFADTARFKMVEGIMTLPEERWGTPCTLCNQPGGATISCAECAVPFHSSCAFLSGHKFGFEFDLAQAKPGKPLPVVVKFKEEAGVMTPRCFCKSHNLEGRILYDMHEIDPEQNETALQIYLSTCRSLRPAEQPRDQLHDEAFALLRKAKRLDRQIPGAVPVLPAQKVCADCEVDVSPIWREVWYEDGGDEKVGVDGMDVHVEDAGREKKRMKRSKVVCHQCHFAYDT